MTILAIDPGSDRSAFVLWNGERIRDHLKLPNMELLKYPFPLLDVEAVAIEFPQCYGMAVGREVLETCEWAGIFRKHFGLERCLKVSRVAVKIHLCHAAHAKDGNVRQALIDRIGEPHRYEMRERIGKRGQPIKPERVRVPGPTDGIAADEWAALAVAVYAWDKIKMESMDAMDRIAANQEREDS